MREILFRGKAVDNGEFLKCKGKWVEGGIAFYKDRTPYICPERFSDYDEEIEVDPETVSEFTGLYDRNGKRIFEGDIVKANVGEREYEDEYLSNTNILVSFENGYFYPFAISCGWRSWVSDIEVIGNKWDNPELLEDKE